MRRSLQQRRRALRDLVLSFGASEAMPNPFLAPGDHERAGVALEAAALDVHKLALAAVKHVIDEKRYEKIGRAHV